MNKDEMNQM